jgi:hypothetical protein
MARDAENVPCVGHHWILHSVTCFSPCIPWQCVDSFCGHAFLCQVKTAEKATAGMGTIYTAPKAQLHKFSEELETKYRVGTFHGCPVYGAVINPESGCYDYLGETELHLVWDVDQSKLVGEGTNDVELVLKCVLWWKEELKHDPGTGLCQTPKHRISKLETLAPRQ